MSRKFNHSKVNMQKRITSEYHLYGDPTKKVMFADGSREIGTKPSSLPVIPKAKRKSKRHKSY